MIILFWPILDEIDTARFVYIIVVIAIVYDGRGCAASTSRSVVRDGHGLTDCLAFAEDAATATAATAVRTDRRRIVL